MMWVTVLFIVFKQNTAYEMRISDWSSDVCSPDLRRQLATVRLVEGASGNVKMQNPAGEHDDAAVTVAMAAVLLLAEAVGTARLSNPAESRSEERRVGHGCVSTC